VWVTLVRLKNKNYPDGRIPHMLLNKKSDVLRVILGYSYGVMCFWSSSNKLVQRFSSHSMSSADVTETGLTPLNLCQLPEKVLAVGTGISALGCSMFQFTLQIN
jgi:hypothetical protein